MEGGEELVGKRLFVRSFVRSFVTMEILKEIGVGGSEYESFSIPLSFFSYPSIRYNNTHRIQVLLL